MTSSTFQVINPATAESIETCDATTAEQLDAIVDQTQQAARGWRDDLDARREALRKCGKALSKRRTAMDLAGLLTKEQGILNITNY